MGRKPCCEKVGLKRGPWTAEEDRKLVSYITNSGLGCWRAIPKLAGLLRCGKSCRLRWTNYLRPDLKRGIFSEEEENLILELHATLGNRWSRIAAQLPGRTDNEIKNYWNTRLKKRLRSQGLDPSTHLPLDSSNQEDGTGDDSGSPDGEDGDSSDAGGTKSESRKVKKAAKAQEPAKPVRQPRGPKPAPQLKMCQSDEGPVLIKVPTSSTSVINPAPASCKCDDDQHSEFSSSSTVTTKSGAEDHHESTLACSLTSLPSYPEAELWKSIKPSTTSTSPLSTTTTTTTVLDEWESYRHVDPSVLNPYPAQPEYTVSPKFEEMNYAKPAIPSSPLGMLDSAGMQQADMMHFNSQDFVGENYGGIFQGPCFAQPEMGMPWSMDVEMGQPAPEPLFAPSPMHMNPAGFYNRDVQQPAPHQQSQELRRLAALLDLI